MASSSSSPSGSVSVSASASPPPPASMDPSTVLEECRSILELDIEGEREEALARAAVLAQAQPNSAAAQNVAGSLYYNAGVVAFKRLSSESEIRPVVERYFDPSVKYYSAAAQLAPACVATAMAHADALTATGRHKEAYAEYHRAASTPDPADPEANNPGQVSMRSPEDSKRLIKGTAKRTLRNFERWINHSYIPSQATKVMLGLKSGLPNVEQVDLNSGLANAEQVGLKTGLTNAAEAVKEANSLAKTFPFSARAHLLRGYASLEQASLLPQNLNSRPFLERALDNITNAAEQFHRSLLIALFRAKLLYQLGQNEEAVIECTRALSIRRPDDPAKQNLLKIEGGACRKTRISSVQKELLLVLEYLSPGSAGNFVQDDESGEDDDDASSSDGEPVHRQSTMYAHSALHLRAGAEWRPLHRQQQQEQDPPPHLIYYVAGEMVPLKTVNVFALHCQARARCSRKKTVCHVCSFEIGYDARIESSTMAWHYIDEHLQGKDKRTSEAVVCNEEGCYVRTRTTKDMRLHYHFVHRLALNWWIT